MEKHISPLPNLSEPYGTLAAMLQDSTEEWRAEIREDLSPEITTWRPYPGGPTIGGIILHMIMAEVAWIEDFILKTKPTPETKTELLWDQIDVDEEIWPDVPAQPLSWYYQLHDQYRQRILNALRTGPDANTLITSERGNKFSPLWVINHIIQHEAYHGGQIVMLYTMYNKIKV